MEGLENPQRFQLKAFRHLEKNTMTTERSKKKTSLTPPENLTCPLKRDHFKQEKPHLPTITWKSCHSCLASCRTIGSYSIAAKSFPFLGGLRGGTPTTNYHTTDLRKRTQQKKKAGRFRNWKIINFYSFFQPGACF